MTPHKKQMFVQKYFHIYQAAQRKDPYCKCKRPWARAARRAGLSVAYLKHLEDEPWSNCTWKQWRALRRRVRGALTLLAGL